MLISESGRLPDVGALIPGRGDPELDYLRQLAKRPGQGFGATPVAAADDHPVLKALFLLVETVRQVRNGNS